ncbi:MAG: ATP-binding protein [Scytonematopsis contorta HA4267-MV1]|jgi:energy-coupling factor transporter ATP-binding protein EcfA2|nr:ATP-binding protein [Scytonematopsis contorta HA4267-MV1]
MENNEFNSELLQKTTQHKINYFVNYTMAHPHLIAAFKELQQAIYQSPGTSLIFVVGPTGVGKTTLLQRLVQKLTSDKISELELDRGQIPIFGFEATSPEFSQFNWKDFYIRLLKALQDPFVEVKIKYQNSTSCWRQAVESALINRHPDAFYIDEAHHLAMLPSGRKLKEQPEVLKSIANIAKIKIIPTGTYELLPLIDLGEQLCRRSKTIHFARYRVDNSGELTEFKSVLQTFQNNLPINETPDLVSNWEFIYEHTLGCVGMCKDWLTETLIDVLSNRKNPTTITLSDLERHARPTSQCLKILKVIQQGEKKLLPDITELSQLRKALGLPAERYDETLYAADNQEYAEKNNQVKRKRKKVGQASPQRYPVGDSENGK